MNKSQDWNFRWCAISETHEGKFFIDEDKQIAWIQSDKVNDWLLFWKETEVSTTSLWISNAVKYVIELQEENANTILEDINIAYESRINRIISDKNNSNIDEQQAA